MKGKVVKVYEYDGDTCTGVLVHLDMERIEICQANRVSRTYNLDDINTIDAFNDGTDEAVRFYDAQDAGLLHDASEEIHLHVERLIKRIDPNLHTAVDRNTHIDMFIDMLAQMKS